VVTGVAPILAPLIGGGVLAVSSWRGIFVVLTVVGVGLLCVALRGVPETLPAPERHSGGLGATVRTLGRLASDRTFAPYCVSFACSFGAMFAYISGGSYVIENVFGSSPQVFSVVFAANSVGLVAMSRCSAQIVGRFGPARLLRWGLMGVCAASLAALAVTAARTSIWPLLIVLFCLVSANGVVLPNGIAAAMTGQPDALGSASALIGLAQFGLGAALAPLVGLGGSHDALPMGIVMATCGVVALSVNLGLSG
jgi:MFS transporter, DHA1 family, multidrug resistance protein